MSGIVGVVSESECMNDLFYPTDYHAHLGTRYGGIAISDGNRLVRRVHSIKRANFKSRFLEDIEFQTLHGNKGIGVISDKDYQPLLAKLKFGDYAIVGAGYIHNHPAIVSKLISEGSSFSESKEGEINQIELASKLINRGNDLIDGINYMNSQIEGSMSLLILGKEGIYASRAKYGHTPLVLGEKVTEGRRTKIISMESSAFKNLGFKKTRYLGPNEIVFLSETREEQLQKPGQISQLCSFFYVYTGFPASSYADRSVTAFRLSLGEKIAEKETKEIDGVWGVQDSGIIYALGFSNKSKVPLIPVTFKYHDSYGRSYIPLIQEQRNFIARMKQIEVDDDNLAEGKELLITEDSIVRGTQLKNFYVSKLWRLGVKGVHIRTACPALMWPCKYILSTRNNGELFAREILKKIHGREISDEELLPYLNPDSSQYAKMIACMEQDIKKTSLNVSGIADEEKHFSLKYPRLEDMIEPIGKPQDSLCTYCWNGCDRCR